VTRPILHRQTPVFGQHDDGTVCDHLVNSRGRPDRVDAARCTGRTIYASRCSCGHGVRGTRDEVAAWKLTHATMPLVPVDHLTAATADYPYRAVCKCGWRSIDFRLPVSMRVDRDTHLRTAVGSIRWLTEPPAEPEGQR